MQDLNENSTPRRDDRPGPGTAPIPGTRPGRRWPGAFVARHSRLCTAPGDAMCTPGPVDFLAALPEEECARLARGGDRGAFGELYRRHFEHVYDFIFHTVRNHADAAELTQDTFLRAMRSIRQLSDPAAFRAWLFTVARNVVLNHLRVRRAETPFPGDWEEVSLEGEDDSRELLRVVWDAAAALSPAEYTLLDLHVRRELGGAEIARELGSPVNSIYVRLSRARARLQELVVTLLLAERAPGTCRPLADELATRKNPGLATVAKIVKGHLGTCEPCRAAAARTPAGTALLGALPVAGPGTTPALPPTDSR